MSLVKKDIVYNISNKAHVPLLQSLKILQHTLNFIKKNSKGGHIKISNFGTFSYKVSPERIGRNPKTKEQFLISKQSKLSFKTSNKVKSILN